jgi:hypothetical protein
MKMIAILFAALGLINYKRVSSLKEKVKTEQDEQAKARLNKTLKSTTLTYKVMLACAIILLVASFVIPILI